MNKYSFKLKIASTFFNNEKSTAKLINSLVDFDRNDIQMILVNDGTTDNTLVF